MRRFALLTCLVLLASGTARALVPLTSEGGFLFDVFDLTLGYLSQGSDNAYDAAYSLRVDGVAYDAHMIPITRSLDDRQVEMPEVTVSDFRVRRLVYVPETGGDYARYLDVVTNDTAGALTARIQVSGNLGSNAATIVTASSNADTSVGTDDTWFTSDDDMDSAGTPALGHVIRGPGSRATLRRARLGGTPPAAADTFEWEFEVDIPAESRVAILTFAIQKATRAAAQTEAERLSTPDAAALVGLDEYLGDIVNFDIGVPQIAIEGPTDSVPEGQDIVLDATVTDSDGEVTFSWDLDGNGEFGEAPGEANVTIPGTELDGDNELRVSLQATDGTYTAVKHFDLEIDNVDPMITSSPITQAFLGATYRYELVVNEPGGVNDPLDIQLVHSPDGMEVDGLALVWDPPRSYRGETVPVELIVSDDEDGYDSQSFEIVISNNRPPTQPVLVSPIERVRIDETQPRLVVMNATDEDADELRYFFEIDRTSAFRDPFFKSGPLQEGEDGMTSYTVPAPLDSGVWYWQAWVSDGLVDSRPRLYGVFILGDEPDFEVDGGRRDGATGGDDEGGRCDCSVPSSRSDGRVLLFGLALLGLIVSRQRRR